jgi:hypothetical protein
MALSYNTIDPSFENHRVAPRLPPPQPLTLNRPVVVWFGAGFAGFLAYCFAAAAIILVVRGC